jgi:hypothetical protein
VQDNSVSVDCTVTIFREPSPYGVSPEDHDFDIERIVLLDFIHRLVSQKIEE